MNPAWIKFNSIPNGTRIFNHGYDQCVALANHYHEGTIGGPFVPVNSAYEWWTRYDELPQINRYYTRSAVPVPGALFVAFGGIYDGVNGHIGNVVQLHAGGFVTMEQNTGPYAPQRYVYRHFRVNDDSVLGFLVPRNNPATEKEEEVTEEEINKIATRVVDRLLNTEVVRDGTKGKGRTTLKKLIEQTETLLRRSISRAEAAGRISEAARMHARNAVLALREVRRAVKVPTTLTASEKAADRADATAVAAVATLDEDKGGEQG